MSGFLYLYSLACLGDLDALTWVVLLQAPVAMLMKLEVKHG